MIQRYEGNGRMSRVVTFQDTVYLCGQTCYDPTQATKSIQEQTKIVLGKIDKLLDQHESSKEDILSTTIYLKEMKDFVAMNEVWDHWVVKGKEPARACVEAAMAKEEVLIEISVIAAKQV